MKIYFMGEGEVEGEVEGEGNMNYVCLVYKSNPYYI